MADDFVLESSLGSEEHCDIRRDLNAYRERQSDSYDCHDRHPDNETEIWCFRMIAPAAGLHACHDNLTLEFVWKLSLSLANRQPNG